MVVNRTKGHRKEYRRNKQTFSKVHVVLYLKYSLFKKLRTAYLCCEVSMRVADVSTLITSPEVTPLGVWVLSVADAFVFVPSDALLLLFPLLQLSKTTNNTAAEIYFFIK